MRFTESLLVSKCGKVICGVEFLHWCTGAFFPSVIIKCGIKTHVRLREQYLHIVETMLFESVEQESKFKGDDKKNYNPRQSHTADKLPLQHCANPHFLCICGA